MSHKIAYVVLAGTLPAPLALTLKGASLFPVTEHLGKDALLYDADGNHTRGSIADVVEACFGRGANLRRRIHRERPSAFQATGSAGGHSQGGEEALRFFEARRKEAPQE